jgi:hypothetical protein
MATVIAWAALITVLGVVRDRPEDEVESFLFLMTLPFTAFTGYAFSQQWFLRLDDVELSKVASDIPTSAMLVELRQRQLTTALQQRAAKVRQVRAARVLPVRVPAPSSRPPPVWVSPPPIPTLPLLHAPAPRPSWASSSPCCVLSPLGLPLSDSYHPTFPSRRVSPVPLSCVASNAFTCWCCFFVRTL